ncbi:MAG: MFS transporter [Acidobacteria bacterium]|nr:MAG: MFS transporter [Acidobacteriota bacterium]
MAQSRLKTSLRAFRYRNFRLFFAGQLTSLVGTWMQTVAQSWLVYRLTGSATLLGVVGFASQIPILILAPIAGAVADTYPRRRSMLAIQTAAMLLAFPLAALTLLNRIHVWHIIVLAVLLGFVNAFDIPVRQSFVAEMVGREDLVNAIALNSSMMNGARIIGPAIAGIVVAAVGEGWCFLINGLSYLAVIVGLLFITAGNQPPQEERGSYMEAILEGFRFVLRTRPVRMLLIMIGVVSLMGMPYSVLMPIFADNILNGGAKGLGLLMGFSGVGALLGAITLAGRQGIRGLSNWVMLACMGFGTSLILFSASHVFWLSTLLLVPVGFCMMVQLASSNTLIQSMVPDRLRGRVMAVYSMMFLGMAPFGALYAGLLANQLGAPLTVAIGGAVCIGGAAIFRSKLPTVRAEGRQLILAQMMTAGEPADNQAPNISS